jgi:ribonuclease-3
MLSNLLRLLGLKSDKAEIERLQDILGYRFNNPALLEEALTHRSLLNTPGNEKLPSYERLEFLGDSVLGICVAEYLHNRFDEFTEGQLTKLKAALVNIHSLTELARSLELGKFIRLSPEERRAGGDDRPSILSDVFESITGAIFLDGDLNEARRWIGRVLFDDFDQWRSTIQHVNYKGNLLECLQGRNLGMPRYDVLNETGPDHDKTFTVCVYCMNKQMGVGRGSSKKEAEQAAAEEALKKIATDESEFLLEKDD